MSRYFLLWNIHLLLIVIIIFILDSRRPLSTMESLNYFPTLVAALDIYFHHWVPSSWSRLCLIKCLPAPPYSGWIDLLTPSHLCCGKWQSLHLMRITISLVMQLMPLIVLYQGFNWTSTYYYSVLILTDAVAKLLIIPGLDLCVLCSQVVWATPPSSCVLSDQNKMLANWIE